MDAPNRNTLWANIFVDELARAGLRAAVIAPGSRSTPLTVAFARHPDITVYSLLDERGAAFFALGLALSGGQAAALVCTSGTATANFYPTVIEADAAHVPLLLLTTDRPPELRHSGANQTVDQIKLYGDHVRWFVDVALPEADPPAVVLRALRTLAGRALAATTGFPPGPVHLNFPFRKPLEPTSEPNDNTAPAGAPPRSGSAPFVHISRGTLQPSTEQVADVSAALRRARRGLIVCGPRCPGGDFPAAVVQLAQESGFPIFADALSGVRFGPHTTGAPLIAGYETFLQPDVVSGWEAPEIILQFGAVPISKGLMAYLSDSGDAQRFQVSSTGVWQDDSHRTGHFVWADPAALCRAAAGQLAQKPPPPRDETWLAQLRRAETETWQAVETAQAAGFFEGTILSDVVELMPSPGQLFVASSLPVRHLDQFARPAARNLRVFANRGA
ncbi:MAG: 2-succinyl-5-enolpyruvyl-6-hydroxy-3-cyclohexene-1-carboxylic-acid synthase, partial [Chloroflexi bacterium]